MIILYTSKVKSDARENCLCEESYDSDFSKRTDKDFQSCVEYYGIGQIADWCAGCQSTAKITVDSNDD